MNETLNVAPARLVWSVAALVQAVADALAARFSPCAVRGEVSGFSRAASGHCYFNLKDAHGGAALLRCAMFRRAAGLLDFVPEDGQLVELRGRLGVYEPRGELQLVVESMQRAGAGALYEQFLKLKARLEAEGLFDAVHKRPVPAFAQRVGVVTSLAAAALRDVVTTFARRSPHVQVLVYPSQVQGADAPASLCEALALAAQRNEVDTLILCRGGGSLEDLWAFNDERVVRAIRASPIPLICGVGHETDVTLADFAADLRAPTPTAAAELVTPAREEQERKLEQQAHALRRGAQRQLLGLAQRLDRVTQRLGTPGERVAVERGRLELLTRRLQHAVRTGLTARQEAVNRTQAALMHRGQAALARHRHAWALWSARLRALDPLAVVQRGFALVETEAGTLVLDPDQLVADQELRLRLARGVARIRLASSRRE